MPRDVFGWGGPPNDDAERAAKLELDRMTAPSFGAPGAAVGGPASPLERLATSMNERRRGRARGALTPEDRAGFHGGGFTGAASISGSVGSSLGFGGGVNPGARRTPPPPDAVPLRRRGDAPSHTYEVQMANPWHAGNGNGHELAATGTLDDDSANLLEDRAQLAEDRARLAEDRAFVAEERMVALERRAQIVEERASQAEARARAAEEAVAKAIEDADELRQRIAEAEARANEAKAEAAKPRASASRPRARAHGSTRRPPGAKPAPAPKPARGPKPPAPARPTRSAGRLPGGPAGTRAEAQPQEESAPPETSPRLGGVLGRRLAVPPGAEVVTNGA